MEKETLSEFPISLKSKIPVMVSERFDRVVVFNESSGLKKLDDNEQNEKHIVKAVHNDGKVPTPEYKRIERPLEAKSEVFFNAPTRCFIYGSEFFEPLTYYAVAEDIDFIRNFNNAHKFLQMSSRQLEIVFEAIESIVKDGITESPSIEQVLYLLDTNAPPYPVVEAIFNYWYTKPKLSGSVIKMMEFPPEHANIRQAQIKYVASRNKQRKLQNDSGYMRRLRSELDEVRKMRAVAIELLEEQKTKRREDIIFLRQIVRKAKSNADKKFALILEPMLYKEDIEIDSDHKINCSLPGPQTTPSFLNWCQEQHIVDN